MTDQKIRLTTTASGGGCSCKLPAAQLEALLADVFGTGPEAGGAALGGWAAAAHGNGSAPDRSGPRHGTGAGPGVWEVICGLESGDDALVVRLDDTRAIVTTTDFFPPVVDDAFDWGRIAAANALSDVWAMGGEPVSALNLLAWPVETLPLELAAEVLRGGRAIAAEAGCVLAGGHSIKDDTPKYGLAVTGLADPRSLLRNDAGRPGDPLTLTKPIGLGVLNNRHKATSEVFPEAIATMVSLNRDASRAALARGIRAATDVTGFGLLGHLFKLARASGVTAVLDGSAVPVLAGARESLGEGYVPGGTRQNLEWVRPHLESALSEEELLLLADAQTSGGLLVAGEIPGFPVIGELVARRDGATLVVG
jgi:selenide,water dikinase